MFGKRKAKLIPINFVFENGRKEWCPFRAVPDVGEIIHLEESYAAEVFSGELVGDYVVEKREYSLGSGYVSRNGMNMIFVYIKKIIHQENVQP